MYRKILMVTLIITLLLFFVSNISAVNSIDELAYVIAVGIDKADNEKFKVSFQITLPNIKSESSGSNKSTDIQTTINTVECNTFYSGITLVNSYISRKLNLSHCKMIVFSEKVAAEGLSTQISSFMNNIDLRPTCNILVSRCDAKYFLENSKTILDKMASKYTEIESTSEKNTGYTKLVTLNDFYNKLYDSFGEPYAILGDINGKEESNNETFDDSEHAFEIPIDSKYNTERIGLAVFKKDKLVGELNGIETICHMIITNNLKSTTLAIPSPFDDSKFISIYIANTKSKNSVEIINNSPFIKCNITIPIRILSVSASSNYLSNDNIKKIEEYANSYFNYHIKKYLNKISKEYQSDIASFGKYVISDFNNIKSWNEYNWRNKFKNSVFSVNVDSKVISSYLITETK